MAKVASETPEMTTPEQIIAERKFNRALLLISAIALLLRIISSLEICAFKGGGNNVFAPPPTSDLATYMELGRQCAAGNLPKEFYYQPFYYTVFLGLIYFFSGTAAVYTTIAIQILLSTATVYLTGVTARKIFNPTAGIAAAVMCAISSPLLLYVPFHQNETLQTFNVILLLFLLLKTLDHQRKRDHLLLGVVTGICILTRGNIWLLTPAIFFLPLVQMRKSGKSWKTILLNLAICFCALIIVQLPFAIHNTLARGELTGPSTAADAVLAIGNNQEAPAGGREMLNAGAMYYPEAYNRMIRRSSRPGGTSVAGQMWERFCDEPLVFCELQLRKLLIFWDGVEIPNNVSLYTEGFASVIIRYLYPGRSMFLLSLALAGIFWLLPELCRKKDLKLFALYAFMLLFYGAVTVFYMLSRFRAPILPVLFIFGGGLICRWQEYFRDFTTGKALEKVARPLLVYLLALFFVFGAYPFYRINLEPHLLAVIQSGGIVLDNGGQDIQHFDHGPRPFGGWTEIKVEPGMRLTKKFHRPGTEQGVLYLALGNLEESEITIRINGAPCKLRLPAQTPIRYKQRFFAINAFALDGIVDVEFVDVPSPVAVVYDAQRRYDRSWLNGSPLKGEWVIRFGSFNR